MQFFFAVRGQFPAGDDVAARFEELLAQARLARQLGFDGISKSSHYSSTPFQEIQQLPFLARIAAEVPGMWLATRIVLLPLHKPLDIAEQLAAIDLFSGGKLIFGAGIGYREVEFKAFGTTQKDRVPRFVENLEAIKRLWAEDSVTMQGSHFTLEDAVCSLKPLQKPRPPIWIGANADAAIRRAAHIGDSLMINPHNRIDTTVRQIELYRRELDSLDKPFPATLAMSREMFIGRDRTDALARARPYLERKYAAYHQWGQDKAMPKGDDDLGQSYEDLADARFLLGSANEVADGLIALARATGVNSFSCPVQWPGMPQGEVVEQMHRLAEDVMPKVRPELRTS